MARTLEDIRSDRVGRETLHNLVLVLEAKLSLAARLGVAEYEAGEDGLPMCADAFRRIADDDRRDIRSLLELLCDQLNALLPTPPADLAERRSHPSHDRPS